MKEKGIVPNIENWCPNVFPLSYNQENLWFTHQYLNENPQYNLINASYIKGSLNENYLYQSIYEILQRYDIFRTTFHYENQSLYQKKNQEFQHKLIIDDLSLYDEAEKINKVQSAIEFEQQYVYHLDELPLYRIAVLKLDSQRHILIMNIHHIISDAWSLQLFRKRIMESYVFRCKNQKPIEDMICQYTDYVNWERECVKNGYFDQERVYWRKQLQNYDSFFHFHKDVDFLANKDWNSEASIEIVLPEKIRNKLDCACKELSGTQYMFTLAAYLSLLFRFTGSNDLCIGTPVSLRDQKKWENTMGNMVNTVLFHLQIDEQNSFRDLFYRIREKVIDIYDHSHYPYELIVQELNKTNSIGSPLLFETFFSLYHVIENSKIFEDSLEITSIPIKRKYSRFYLSLDIELSENAIRLVFEYDHQVFSKAAIESFANAYSCFLENVLEDNTQRINTVPLMNQRDYELFFWNKTERVFMVKNGLYYQIENSMLRHANKIAISNYDQQITYGELQEYINSTCEYLRIQGICPGDGVAMIQSKKLNQLILILAILKNGGYYIPIATNVTKVRLQDILHNSKCKAVVIDQKRDDIEVSGVLEIKIEDCRTIKLTSLCTHRKTTDQITACEQAYIMYTSGSTGKPKGVQVTQSAVLNLLFSMHEEPGIDEDDCLLSVTNYTFDISVLEMLGPLLVGAEVILMNQYDAMDSRELLKALEQNNVTIMQATPQTWRMLFRAGWKGSSQLKVLCGGEKLDSELAKQLVEKTGEVWNMYGPTETTIWSSIYRVENVSPNIPIGQPIANTKIYVLDSNLQPIPPNFIGDIYIGGAGVSLGYCGMDELTRNNFMIDCLMGSGMMYKTGDKGMFDHSGLLYFIGRDDDQLKVRGFRVEAQEVEFWVNSYPGINNCVVRKYVSDVNEDALAAYIEASGKIKLQELQEYLITKLPTYMVPNFYVQVRQFPMNEHGKIDLRQLSMQTVTEIKQNEYIGPRNDMELKMQSIWKHVLKQDKISVTDKFFNLGGQSLTGTILLTYINQEYGVELPLKLLFEYPTIEGLCNVILEKQLERLDDDELSKLLD